MLKVVVDEGNDGLEEQLSKVVLDELAFGSSFGAANTGWKR